MNVYGAFLKSPTFNLKPGTCPPLLRGSLGPCVEKCLSDGDCGKAEKCCSTSCGHVCKAPILGKPPPLHRPIAAPPPPPCPCHPGERLLTVFSLPHTPLCLGSLPP
uniref:WAP domain-containing protein n=1 Tax=Sphenodon punctatus TaxID=8508 RepID=A0A8D0LD06_SPHPU